MVDGWAKGIFERFCGIWPVLAGFGRFWPVFAISVMLRPDEDSLSDLPVPVVDVLGRKDADRRSTLPAAGARHVAVLRMSI